MRLFHSATCSLLSTPRATSAKTTSHNSPLIKKNRNPATPSVFSVSMLAITAAKVQPECFIWSNCKCTEFQEMSIRISLVFVFLFSLVFTSVVSAQRSSSKSTKIEVVQFPTIPADAAYRIGFQLHADDAFFNLEDLRRYGGNMDLLKSSGERLSGMKYFTVGQEAEVVDVGPTVQVDVAIGPERQGAPKMSSEAVKGSEETLTHWANVPCRLPMRVRIASPEGEVWDAFEIDEPLNIRYGNEKISTIESRPGGFTYSKSSLKFSSEAAVMEKLQSPEGARFFRRKAVLLQLSNVIDELETRIFFLEGKVSVEVYSAKGKHEYPELDAARDVALESYDNNYFDGLSSPIDTWGEWAAKVDFTDKRAKVTRAVALGLYLNLAQAHLYRNEFDACAQAISDARALVLPGGEEAALLNDIQSRLMKRRRALDANGTFEMALEAEHEKAPDIKNVVGKRSQNKDVRMVMPEDRFGEIGREIAAWEADAVADSPEAAASQASEVTMAQRLGGRLEQTVGGMMLRLNPLLDPDLVGDDFPAEILDIPNLVYLDISGMKFGALPESIDRLSMLQTLVASRNDLVALPESLGNLTRLKKLFVNKNDLTGLPNSLAMCMELKTVDLKGNPVPADELDRIQQMFGEGVKVKSD
jgi:hypothetical protein